MRCTVHLLKCTDKMRPFPWQCVIDTTCVVCSELCCVSRVSLHRKIPNYDLTWCSELELNQHIVAIASAGGAIGVPVWVGVGVHMHACLCVHVCVC